MTRYDFLAAILTRKRLRVEAARNGLPLEDLAARAVGVRCLSESHTLRHALQREERINIIAEFKRASPSKGMIRPGSSAAETAKAYTDGGAAAISVLTEEDNFLGSLDDLRAVRSATSLPILRKDFIFDEYQLYESAETGADALLLIVAALDDQRLQRLRRITEEELGMDALVEVHTEMDLRRALQCGATLIGVNNRDLRTFEVSLDVSVKMAGHISSQTLLVSESGLRTSLDIQRLHALGYRGFLMGETLMRAAQPAAELRALVGLQKG